MFFSNIKVKCTDARLTTNKTPAICRFYKEKKRHEEKKKLKKNKTKTLQFFINVFYFSVFLLEVEAKTKHLEKIVKNHKKYR